MQLSKPLPIRSPLNKASANKDYSYTSPLSADGSDYPCKGYHKDAFDVAAEFTAGEEYEIKITGGATHSGGSCQLSLSYDEGKTFKVIKSMIRGCPLKSSYKFTIPSDAPAGNALFAWSWFNRLGNREMYMNCVQSKITSGTKSAEKRSVTFSQRPDIFLANINHPTQCKTIAGEEVVFPDAGPDVEYSSDAKDNTSKGFTCQRMIESPKPSVEHQEPAPTTTPTVPSLPTDITKYTTKTYGTSGLYKPTCANQGTSGSETRSGMARPTALVGGTYCVRGTVRCESPAAFSLCAGPDLGYVRIGAVPDGFMCEGAALRLAN